MNIFETIKKAGALNERCHSQFLADTLNESISPNGDRSLFDRFWKLITPYNWDIPIHAEITPEYVVRTGKIDIVIRSGDSHDRIVGIEIKITDDSVEEGQLEKYREGLAEKHPDSELAMAYLTPFNRECAGKSVDSRKDVREFDNFARNFDNARHISWLDVADIPWDGNLLWEQHRAFVRGDISSKEFLDEKISERQTSEGFLASCEDVKVCDAASRLFDTATREGANIQSLGKDGLWIQIWCSLVNFQVSIAWMYPPGLSGGYGFEHFKDFSFGARVSTLDSSHPRLQEILEQWIDIWCLNRRFPTQNVDNDEGIKAYSVSPDDAVEHIDFVENRLKWVITEVSKLR